MSSPESTLAATQTPTTLLGSQILLLISQVGHLVTSTEINLEQIEVTRMCLSQRVHKLNLLTSVEQNTLLMSSAYEQLLAFDELKNDHRNPVDVCKSVNPVHISPSPFPFSFPFSVFPCTLSSFSVFHIIYMLLLFCVADQRFQPASCDVIFGPMRNADHFANHRLPMHYAHTGPERSGYFGNMRCKPY